MTEGFRQLVTADKWVKAHVRDQVSPEQRRPLYTEAKSLETGSANIQGPSCPILLRAEVQGLIDATGKDVIVVPHEDGKSFTYQIADNTEQYVAPQSTSVSHDVILQNPNLASQYLSDLAIEHLALLEQCGTPTESLMERLDAYEMLTSSVRRRLADPEERSRARHEIKPTIRALERVVQPTTIFDASSIRR